MEPTFQIATNITYNHVVQNIEHLTFPPFQKKIRSMPIQEPYTGVWALKENKMMGIVLAETNNRGISELFSFFVLPKYRNKGIGNQLLTILQDTLRNKGIKALRSRYWSNWGSIVAVEKMLRSHGWELPQVIRTIAHTSINAYPAVNWPRFIFSSDYEIVNWGTITTEDKDHLRTLLANGQISSGFTPFQHEDQIFLPVSLGLRYQGKIVGWNIAYSFNSETLEHNNLFVLPEIRNRGLALKLLHDSLSLQYKLKIPKVTWLLNEDNKLAKKVIGRLTNEHIEKKIVVRASQKLL